MPLVHYSSISPPYSPDFMPCEGIFSQVKGWIRENDQEWQMCDQPENMVMEGFLNYSDEEVRNYIWHSEYLQTYRPFCLVVSR